MKHLAAKKRGNRPLVLERNLESDFSKVCPACELNRLPAHRGWNRLRRL